MKNSNEFNYKLMPIKATYAMKTAAEKYWEENRMRWFSKSSFTWAGLYDAMQATMPNLDLSLSNLNKFEKDKVLSVNDILREALVRIRNDHGLAIHTIDASWLSTFCDTYVDISEVSASGNACDFINTYSDEEQHDILISNLRNLEDV